MFRKYSLIISVVFAQMLLLWLVCMTKSLLLLKSGMQRWSFIELSEAFDAVDHHILILKLEYYRVRGRWFKGYLRGRQQYVKFNAICSDCEPFQINCGVPQCSILGSLLFLLYINNLCNVPKLVDSTLFADDTFSHKDLNLLSENLNSEMCKLTLWCRANQLSVNSFGVV